jgi:putative transposase
MPRGVQRRSTISERQRVLLEELSRRHGTGQQVALRARLVLATAEQPGTEVAAEYGVDRDTVGLWRARWQAAQERLTALEAADTPERELRAAVAAVLRDAPRPGTPPTFTAPQVIGIVKLACTPPQEADCPCSQWSARELAAAALRQGIVQTISPRTVGRFLKGGRLAATPEPLLADAARGPGDLRPGGAGGV